MSILELCVALLFGYSLGLSIYVYCLSCKYAILSKDVRDSFNLTKDVLNNNKNLIEISSTALNELHKVSAIK